MEVGNGQYLESFPPSLQCDEIDEDDDDDGHFVIALDESVQGNDESDGSTALTNSQDSNTCTDRVEVLSTEIHKDDAMCEQSYLIKNKDQSLMDDVTGNVTNDNSKQGTCVSNPFSHEPLNSGLLLECTTEDIVYNPGPVVERSDCDGPPGEIPNIPDFLVSSPDIIRRLKTSLIDHSVSHCESNNFPATSDSGNKSQAANCVTNCSEHVNKPSVAQHRLDFTPRDDCSCIMCNKWDSSKFIPNISANSSRSSFKLSQGLNDHNTSEMIGPTISTNNIPSIGNKMLHIVSNAGQKSCTVSFSAKQQTYPIHSTQSILSSSNVACTSVAENMKTQPSIQSAKTKKTNVSVVPHSGTKGMEELFFQKRCNPVLKSNGSYFLLLSQPLVSCSNSTKKTSNISLLKKLIPEVNTKEGKLLVLTKDFMTAYRPDLRPLLKRARQIDLSLPGVVCLILSDKVLDTNANNNNSKNEGSSARLLVQSTGNSDKNYSTCNSSNDMQMTSTNVTRDDVCKTLLKVIDSHFQKTNATTHTEMNVGKTFKSSLSVNTGSNNVNGTNSVFQFTPSISQAPPRMTSRNFIENGPKMSIKPQQLSFSSLPPPPPLVRCPTAPVSPHDTLSLSEPASVEDISQKQKQGSNCITNEEPREILVIPIVHKEQSANHNLQTSLNDTQEYINYDSLYTFSAPEETSPIKSPVQFRKEGSSVTYQAPLLKEHQELINNKFTAVMTNLSSATDYSNSSFTSPATSTMPYTLPNAEQYSRNHDIVSNSVPVESSFPSVVTVNLSSCSNISYLSSASVPIVSYLGSTPISANSSMIVTSSVKNSAVSSDSVSLQKQVMMKDPVTIVQQKLIQPTSQSSSPTANFNFPQISQRSSSEPYISLINPTQHSGLTLISTGPSIFKTSVSSPASSISKRCLQRGVMKDSVRTLYQKSSQPTSLSPPTTFHSTQSSQRNVSESCFPINTTQSSLTQPALVFHSTSCSSQIDSSIATTRLSSMVVPSTSLLQTTKTSVPSTTFSSGDAKSLSSCISSSSVSVNGLKLKIRLGDVKNNFDGEESKSETYPGHSDTQEMKSKDLRDANKLAEENLSAKRVETAEEMFQRYQEQAMKEVYNAQFGVGNLSRSLRPTRCNISFVDKSIPRWRLDDGKKKKLSEESNDEINSTEERKNNPSISEALPITPTGSEKDSSKSMTKGNKKRHSSSESRCDIPRKDPKLDINSFPKFQQDNSILMNKTISTPNIMAGHKVFVKFNVFTNPQSGRNFLIPFFNLGGSRVQFDNEDMDYIKKAVIEVEKEEKFCARHLIYYSREDKKASFLRKENLAQTNGINEKSYQKCGYILEGFSREATKKSVPILEEWKVDKKVSIEIDTAEVDNNIVIDFEDSLSGAVVSNSTRSSADSQITLDNAKGHIQIKEKNHFTKKSSESKQLTTEVGSDAVLMQVKQKCKEVEKNVDTISLPIMHLHDPQIQSGINNQGDRNIGISCLPKKLYDREEVQNPIGPSAHIHSPLMENTVDDANNTKSANFRPNILRKQTSILRSKSISGSTASHDQVNSQLLEKTSPVEASYTDQLKELFTSGNLQTSFSAVMTSCLEKGNYDKGGQALQHSNPEDSNFQPPIKAEIIDQEYEQNNSSSQTYVNSSGIGQSESGNLSVTDLRIKSEPSDEYFDSLEKNETRPVSLNVKNVNEVSNYISITSEQSVLNEPLNEKRDMVSKGNNDDRNDNKQQITANIVQLERSDEDTLSAFSCSPTPSSAVSESSEITSSSCIDMSDDDMSDNEEDDTSLSSSTSFTSIVSESPDLSNANLPLPINNTKISSLVESLKQRLCENSSVLPSAFAEPKNQSLIALKKKKVMRKRRKSTKQPIANNFKGIQVENTAILTSSDSVDSQIESQKLKSNADKKTKAISAQSVQCVTPSLSDSSSLVNSPYHPSSSALTASEYSSNLNEALTSAHSTPTLQTSEFSETNCQISDIKKRFPFITSGDIVNRDKRQSTKVLKCISTMNRSVQHSVPDDLVDKSKVADSTKKCQAIDIDIRQNQTEGKLDKVGNELPSHSDSNLTVKDNESLRPATPCSDLEIDVGTESDIDIGTENVFPEDTSPKISYSNWILSSPLPTCGRNNLRDFTREKEFFVSKSNITMQQEIFQNNKKPASNLPHKNFSLPLRPRTAKKAKSPTTKVISTPSTASLLCEKLDIPVEPIVPKLKGKLITPLECNINSESNPVSVPKPINPTFKPSINAIFGVPDIPKSLDTVINNPNFTEEKTSCKNKPHTKKQVFKKGAVRKLKLRIDLKQHKSKRICENEKAKLQTKSKSDTMQNQVDNKHQSGETKKKLGSLLVEVNRYNSLRKFAWRKNSKDKTYIMKTEGSDYVPNSKILEDTVNQENENTPNKKNEDCGKQETVNISNVKEFAVKPCKLLLYKLEDIVWDSGKIPIKTESGTYIIKHSQEHEKEHRASEIVKKRKKKSIAQKKKGKASRPKKDIVDYYEAAIESLRKKALLLEEVEQQQAEKRDVDGQVVIKKEVAEQPEPKEIDGIGYIPEQMNSISENELSYTNSTTESSMSDRNGGKIQDSTVQEIEEIISSDTEIIGKSKILDNQLSAESNCHYKSSYSVKPNIDSENGSNKDYILGNQTPHSPQLYGFDISNENDFHVSTASCTTSNIIENSFKSCEFANRKCVRVAERNYEGEIIQVFSLSFQDQNDIEEMSDCEDGIDFVDCENVDMENCISLESGGETDKGLSNEMDRESCVDTTEIVPQECNENTPWNNEEDVTQKFESVEELFLKDGKSEPAITSQKHKEETLQSNKKFPSVNISESVNETSLNNVKENEDRVILKETVEQINVDNTKVLFQESVEQCEFNKCVESSDKTIIKGKELSNNGDQESLEKHDLSNVCESAAVPDPCEEKLVSCFGDILPPTTSGGSFVHKDIVLGFEDELGADTVFSKLGPEGEDEMFLLGDVDETENMGLIPDEEVERLLGLDVKEGENDSVVESKEDKTINEVKDASIGKLCWEILPDAKSGCEVSKCKEPKNHIGLQDHLILDGLSKKLKSVEKVNDTNICDQRESQKDLETDGRSTSLGGSTDSVDTKCADISPSWKRILGTKALKEIEQSVTNAIATAGGNKESDSGQSQLKSSVKTDKMNIKLCTGTLSKAFKLSAEIRKTYNASDSNTRKVEERKMVKDVENSVINELIPKKGVVNKDKKEESFHHDPLDKIEKGATSKISELDVINPVSVLPEKNRDNSIMLEVNKNSVSSSPISTDIPERNVNTTVKSLGKKNIDLTKLKMKLTTILAEKKKKSTNDDLSQKNSMDSENVKGASHEITEQTIKREEIMIPKQPTISGGNHVKKISFAQMLNTEKLSNILKNLKKPQNLNLPSTKCSKSLTDSSLQHSNSVQVDTNVSCFESQIPTEQKSRVRKRNRSPQNIKADKPVVIEPKRSKLSTNKKRDVLVGDVKDAEEWKGERSCFDCLSGLKPEVWEEN